MSNDDCCNEHKEHIFRLKRNEDDIQLVWKEINGMKKWVIAGMSGLLIEIVVLVVSIALGK